MDYLLIIRYNEGTHSEAYPTKGRLKARRPMSRLLFGALIALSIVLSGKIALNIRHNRAVKQESLQLLAHSVDVSYGQRSLPSKLALSDLEKAYHLGGHSARPYAGFLATCFYLHQDYSRGAHYTQEACLDLPTSPIQKLLKEITEAHGLANHAVVLEKSRELLALTSQEYPTLQLLTLLRIIETKEQMREDAHVEVAQLLAHPLFQEFDHLYSDGEWTLSRRFAANQPKGSYA